MEANEPEAGSSGCLKALYPQLSDTELRDVEETLDDYVQSTLQLYERISADPEAYDAFRAALTERKSKSRMDTKGPMPARAQ